MRVKTLRTIAESTSVQDRFGTERAWEFPPFILLHYQKMDGGNDQARSVPNRPRRPKQIFWSEERSETESDDTQVGLDLNDVRYIVIVSHT